MKKSELKELIKELIKECISQCNLLSQGVYDKYIFKAIFLAGGPGSGKSYISDKILSGFGLKVINSDNMYEYLLKKANIEMNAQSIASKQGQQIRNRAKQLTTKQQSNFLSGRLGLIIDGTGRDLSKIKKVQTMLKQLGYDTSMVFVNTSLQVAKQRNRQRSRVLPDEMVYDLWNKVQKNIGAFQNMFGSNNFIIVDNNNASQSDLAKVNVKIRNMLNRPISNYVAKKWIEQQLKNKKEN